MDRIKVLLLSIHYPFALKNYFENAIWRNPNLDLITCGPYTGRWTPWLGGIELDPKYAVPPTYPLPFKPDIGKVPYELVRAALPNSWHPDLVLTIDAGINWAYKPSEGIVASVFTDGHVLNAHYQHSRGVSDYSFNLHPAYSEPSDVILHYAFDPGMHFAMTDVEKDADAVLIGMPYKNRVDWVDALRREGLKVLFENGPIFDEYRLLNNRARIGLNWSSLDDLNARVFELMAMRLCPVLNRVPDLGRFFTEGEHYLGFRTLAEAIDKVVWAKEHPEECDMIANAAYQKVHQDNLTYDNLILDILKKVGLYG